ncbi:MAG: hypothetical protein ACFBSE_05010 [Prochloraceae cyanobacterium]
MADIKHQTDNCFNILFNPLSPEKIASAIANLSISEGADTLYSQFKFGEVEWAKENYLTNREIALLEQLNNCKQLNLFEDESGENPSDCRF